MGDVNACVQGRLRLGTDDFERCLVDQLGARVHARFVEAQRMIKARQLDCDPKSHRLGPHQEVVYAIARLFAKQAREGRFPDTGDSRGLLVWHNTGSGKTLTALAIMLAFWDMPKTFKIYLVTTPGNHRNNQADTYAQLTRDFFPHKAAELGVDNLEKLMAGGPGESGQVQPPGARIKRTTYEMFANQLFNRGSIKVVSGEPSWEELQRGGAVLIFDEIQNLVKFDGSGSEKKDKAVYDFLTKDQWPGRGTVSNGIASSGRIFSFVLSATPGKTIPEWLSVLNIVRPVRAPGFTPGMATNPQAFRGLISYVDMGLDLSRHARVIGPRNTYVAMDPAYTAAFVDKYGAYFSRSKPPGLTYKHSDPMAYYKRAKQLGNYLTQADAAPWIGPEQWEELKRGGHVVDMTRWRDGRIPDDVRTMKLEREYLVSQKVLKAVENLMATPGKQLLYTSSPETAAIVAKLLSDRGRSPLIDTDLRLAAPNSNGKDELREFYSWGVEKAQGKKMFVLYRSTTKNPLFIKAFNHDRNVTGKYIPIFIATDGNYEGMDLNALRAVHILEPMPNRMIDTQMLGRGARNCGHKKLHADNRTVLIRRYFSIMNKHVTPRSLLKMYPQLASSSLKKWAEYYSIIEGQTRGEKVKYMGADALMHVRALTHRAETEVLDFEKKLRHVSVDGLLFHQRFHTRLGVTLGNRQHLGVLSRAWPSVPAGGQRTRYFHGSGGGGGDNNNNNNQRRNGGHNGTGGNNNSVLEEAVHNATEAAARGSVLKDQFGLEGLGHMLAELKQLLQKAVPPLAQQQRIRNLEAMLANVQQSGTTSAAEIQRLRATIANRNKQAGNWGAKLLAAQEALANRNAELNNAKRAGKASAAAVTNLEARVEQAEVALKAAIANRNAKVLAAQNALANRNAELKKAKNAGNASAVEMSALEARAKKAETALEAAIANRNTRLLEAQEALHAQEAELNSAKKAGKASAAEIKALKARVEQAEAALEANVAKARANRNAELLAAQKALANRNAELKRAKTAGNASAAEMRALETRAEQAEVALKAALKAREANVAEAHANRNAKLLAAQKTLAARITELNNARKAGTKSAAAIKALEANVATAQANRNTIAAEKRELNRLLKERAEELAHAQRKLVGKATLQSNMERLQTEGDMLKKELASVRVQLNTATASVAEMKTLERNKTELETALKAKERTIKKMMQNEKNANARHVTLAEKAAQAEGIQREFESTVKEFESKLKTANLTEKTLRETVAEMKKSISELQGALLAAAAQLPLPPGANAPFANRVAAAAQVPLPPGANAPVANRVAAAAKVPLPARPPAAATAVNRAANVANRVAAAAAAAAAKEQTQRTAALQQAKMRKVAKQQHRLGNLDNATILQIMRSMSMQNVAKLRAVSKHFKTVVNRKARNDTLPVYTQLARDAPQNMFAAAVMAWAIATHRTVLSWKIAKSLAQELRSCVVNLLSQERAKYASRAQNPLLRKLKGALTVSNPPLTRAWTPAKLFQWYLKNMLDPNTYGTSLELELIARVLRCRLVVSYGNVIMRNGEGPELPLIFTPHEARPGLENMAARMIGNYTVPNIQAPISVTVDIRTIRPQFKGSLFCPKQVKRVHDGPEVESDNNGSGVKHGNGGGGVKNGNGGSGSMNVPAETNNEEPSAKRHAKQTTPANMAQLLAAQQMVINAARNAEQKAPQPPANRPRNIRMTNLGSRSRQPTNRKGKAAPPATPNHLQIMRRIVGALNGRQVKNTNLVKLVAEARKLFARQGVKVPKRADPDKMHALFEKYLKTPRPRR